MTELNLFPSKIFLWENFLGSRRENFLQYLITKQPTVLDNETLEVGIDTKDSNFKMFEFFLLEKLNSVLSKNLISKTYISTAWANYSSCRSVMAKHNHLRVLPEFCVYTASYYPNFEYGMGNIRMHDPNKFNNLITNFDQRYHDIDLKMDTLVLFPSWLEHEVLENTTSKIRISFIVDISLT